MNIVYITAGAGSQECDACVRDAGMARALMALGHQVLFIPMYTPLQAAGVDIAVPGMFYGGINVFLQQKLKLFRHTPRFLDRLLDCRWLLNYVARFGHLTQAKDLAELTISMLEGEDGRQLKELNRLLDWLATQPPPDVVVLPNTLLSGLAAPLKRRLGTTVVSMLSGEEWFVDQFPGQYRERALAELRRRAADLDGLLAGHASYAEFMTGYLRMAPERIHAVVPGIDLRGYPDELPAPPETFTIGYRSPLYEQNGLHVLAEAFHLLKSDPATANCRVRVAGYMGPVERKYYGGIEKRLKQWGIERDFEYVGEIERDERARFLAGISALCTPGEYAEPVGMAPPEAMAAGVPVVAPPVGCFREWVELTGGGLLAESAEPAALAAALGRLMKEPELARRLGRQGRRAIREKFSVERAAESAVEVFQKLTDAKRDA